MNRTKEEMEAILREQGFRPTEYVGQWHRTYGPFIHLYDDGTVSVSVSAQGLTLDTALGAIKAFEKAVGK